jgi:hypothetical protein
MSKFITRLLVVLSLGWSGSASALVIEDSEVFVFQFNTLEAVSYPGSTSIPMSISLNYSSSNIFGPSETMRLSFHEDSLTDSPFFSDSLATGTNSSLNRTYRQFFDPHWSDLQGVVRLEMTKGSVDLDTIEIRYTNPRTSSDNYFSVFEITDTSNPPGIPAPATLALFSFGLAGLGWSRRKKV